jgi:hypothetical protein
MNNSVLVISSISLYRNSSVCLANAAYILGLVENGFDVTVVMPSCDEADKDPAMSLPESVRYLIYDRTNPLEQKIAKSIKTPELNLSEKVSFVQMIKLNLRKRLSKIKQKLIKANKKSGFFVNDNYFISQAIRNMKDIGDRKYEYIMSLSSPVSSHYVAERLISTGRLSYLKWIQIWQDPWYHDLYTKKDHSIFEEEFRLLNLADKIVYVSPLTYQYQKEVFPDCANKMIWAFLPCYKTVFYPDMISNKDKITIGYFGEFVSTVRRIEPLAKAVDKCNRVNLIVCGNGDVNLKLFKNIRAYGRVDISKVEELQGECDILVNISNVKGGQIPGKVYQYAGTSKSILFLLDGTDNEMNMLEKVFGKYNRFIFCKNDENDIYNCLCNFDQNNQKTINEPVEDFSGKSVIAKIVGCS